MMATVPASRGQNSRKQKPTAVQSELNRFLMPLARKTTFYAASKVCPAPRRGRWNPPELNALPPRLRNGKTRLFILSFAKIFDFRVTCVSDELYVRLDSVLSRAHVKVE